MLREPDQILFRCDIYPREHPGAPVSEAEILDFLQGFVEKITVWGSDDVLKAVIAF